MENSYSKLSYVQHSPADHLAEIRRVLADPTGEELDLLGGSQNAKALKDVLEYIDLLSGRSQSVNLGALIANSDEAAPSFREDCAPLFRDDVAPSEMGPCRH